MTSEARNAVFARFAYLIRPLAMARLRRLPSSYELADLEQLGALGLLAAATHYDADRNFARYARRWIRGAILDGCDNDRGQSISAEPAQSIADPRPNPEELAILAERGGLVVVLALTKRQHAVMGLRLAGKTQKQASERMGISQQAAAGLEKRAKRRLAA